ncbi:ABC transporter substrate-binding protein [Pseudogemmobacter faecipullorum]|nr:ABC transporter substrate-binding protein [Pseudogemmobacter faecipullorum]
MKSKFMIPAAVAAAAAFGAPGAGSAAELVVGTFGGGFAENLQSCYAERFTAATGAEVLLKPANSAQHAASLRASAGSPDVDVVFADDAFAVQLANEGLLQPLDRSKLSNAPDILEAAWGAQDAYVAAMLGATAIVYNREKLAEPPTSWQDLFDPRYEGRVTIGDISGTTGWQFVAAVNAMEGGALEDPAAALEKIGPLAKSAALLYTQADQVVALFERGEIDLAVWYPDRAGVAIKSGLPLAVAYPEEGAVGIRPTISIPKGAENAELAEKFVDIVLSAEAQKCFSEAQVIGPVNTKVVVEGEYASILPTAEQASRMLFLDPETMARLMPDWTRRWQREVLR